MYDVEFEYTPIDESTQVLRMSYDTGYYVKTIDGLTGVTISPVTWNENDGYGEILSSFRHPSKQLVIRGRILDKQTELKERLLRFFAAGREITMYINTKRFGTRTERYRKAAILIKQTPVITQNRHSEFMITATMLMPFFEGVNEETITLTAGTVMSFTAQGDAEPQYRLDAVISSGTLYGARFVVWHGSTVRQIWIRFSNSTIGLLSTGDEFAIYAENGIIHTYVKKGNATYNDNYTFIAPGSNMSRLLERTQLCSFTLLPDANDTASDAVFSKLEIKYTPIYTGVLVDGV